MLFFYKKTHTQKNMSFNTKINGSTSGASALVPRSGISNLQIQYSISIDEPFVVEVVPPSGVIIPNHSGSYKRVVLPGNDNDFYVPLEVSLSFVSGNLIIRAIQTAPGSAWTSETATITLNGVSSGTLGSITQSATFTSLGPNGFGDITYTLNPAPTSNTDLLIYAHDLPISIGGAINLGNDMYSLRFTPSQSSRTISVTVGSAPIRNFTSKNIVASTLNSADTNYSSGNRGVQTPITINGSSTNEPNIYTPATMQENIAGGQYKGAVYISNKEYVQNYPISVSLTSSDTSALTVSTSSLTFSSGELVKHFTVDTPIDGNSTNDTVGITSAITSSSDSYYPVGNSSSRSITVNDTQGSGGGQPGTMTLSPSSFTITEEGTGQNVSLNLSPAAQPGFTVRISSNNPDIRINGSSTTNLTVPFGSTGINFTVTAIDDTDSLNDTASITAQVLSSSNTSYPVGASTNATVTITDNDSGTPTQGTLSLTPTSATLNEGSSTQTISLNLSTAPLSGTSTTVGFTSSNPDLTFSPQTVTFSAGQTTKTVTLVAGQDTDQASDSGTITATVTTSTSAFYTVGNSTTASFNILDDDVPAIIEPPTNNLILNSTSFTITEGNSESLSVRLQNQPNENVTVRIDQDTGPLTEVSTSPITLTFTPSNYSVNQNFTLTAIDDGVTEGSNSLGYTIRAEEPNSVGTIRTIDSEIINITVNDAVNSNSLEVVYANKISPSGTTYTQGEYISEGADGYKEIIIRKSASDPNPTSPVTVNFSYTGDDLIIIEDSTVLDSSNNYTGYLGVHAKVDPDSNLSESVSISYTTSSSDPSYNGISGTIPLTVLDKGCFGPVNPLRIADISPGQIFQVGNFRLSKQPYTNLSSEFKDPAYLTGLLQGGSNIKTYTTTNWSTAQTYEYRIPSIVNIFGSSHGDIRAVKGYKFFLTQYYNVGTNRVYLDRITQNTLSIENPSSPYTELSGVQIYTPNTVVYSGAVDMYFNLDVNNTSSDNYTLSAITTTPSLISGSIRQSFPQVNAGASELKTFYFDISSTAASTTLYEAIKFVVTITNDTTSQIIDKFGIIIYAIQSPRFTRGKSYFYPTSLNLNEGDTSTAQLYYTIEPTYNYYDYGADYTRIEDSSNNYSNSYFQVSTVAPSNNSSYQDKCQGLINITALNDPSGTLNGPINYDLKRSNSSIVIIPGGTAYYSPEYTGLVTQPGDFPELPITVNYTSGGSGTGDSSPPRISTFPSDSTAILSRSTISGQNLDTNQGNIINWDTTGGGFSLTNSNSNPQPSITGTSGNLGASFTVTRVDNTTFNLNYQTPVVSSTVIDGVTFYVVDDDGILTVSFSIQVQTQKALIANASTNTLVQGGSPATVTLSLSENPTNGDPVDVGVSYTSNGTSSITANQTFITLSSPSYTNAITVTPLPNAALGSAGLLFTTQPSSATNYNGLLASSNFSIIESGDNTRPNLTSNPGVTNATFNITVAPGTTYNEVIDISNLDPTNTVTVTTQGSKGTASASVNAQSDVDLSYVVPTGESGTDNFTIEISDNDGTLTLFYNVTIGASDTLPPVSDEVTPGTTSQTIQINVPEGQTVSRDITFLNLDVNGNITPTSGTTAYGDYTVSRNIDVITFAFTANNTAGTVNVPVTVSDDDGTFNLNYEVTVTAANVGDTNPPRDILNPAFATVSKTINVEAGNTETVSVDIINLDDPGYTIDFPTRATSKGSYTSTLISDVFALEYTANTGTSGTESFTVTITDDDGSLNIIYNVNITPPNQGDSSPPRSVTSPTSANISKTITVAAGASVSDNTTIQNWDTSGSSISPITGTSSFGVYTATRNGNDLELNYTANSGTSGSDSFSITISDDDGDLTIDYAVDVLSENTIAPTLQDGNLNRTLTVLSGQTVSETIQTNNWDSNGNTFVGGLQATTGTTSLGNFSLIRNIDALEVRYTSNAGTSGNDNFSFDITDNDGSITVNYAVTVNSSNVGDANPPRDVSNPTSANITKSINVNQGQSSFIDFTVVDFDSNGTLNPASGTTGKGSYTIANNSNVITATYVASSQATGSDSFTTTLQDDDGTLNVTYNVTINSGQQNNTDPPRDNANPSSSSINKTITVLSGSSSGSDTITLLNWDTNGNVGNISNPTKGNYTTSRSGNNLLVSYIPTQGQTGQDSFVFSVVDDDGTLTVNYSVTIQSSGGGGGTGDTDPPRLSTDPNSSTVNLSFSVNSGQSSTQSYTVNNWDTTGDVVTVTNQGTKGTATATRRVGTDIVDVVYASNQGTSGTDNFVVTVQDDDGSLTLNYTITINSGGQQTGNKDISFFLTSGTQSSLNGITTLSSNQINSYQTSTGSLGGGLIELNYPYDALDTGWNKVRLEEGDSLVANSLFDNLDTQRMTTLQADYRCVAIRNISNPPVTITDLNFVISIYGSFLIEYRYSRQKNISSNPFITNQFNDPSSALDATGFFTAWTLANSNTNIFIEDSSGTNQTFAPNEFIFLWLRRIPANLGGYNQGTITASINFQFGYNVI